jgi:hypothetical protein
VITRCLGFKIGRDMGCDVEASLVGIGGVGVRRKGKENRESLRA